MREKWRLVDSGFLPPPESVATDEAILEAHSSGAAPDTLHLYARSSPTVSVGYFQKTDESIDLDACRRLGVTVVRRGSGGSSIYTDQGQLIYGIVARSDELPATPDASFALVCGAVSKALSSLGVDARHRPVNDVEVGGRKVSGSAQLRRRGSVLQHGTIIVDTDVSVMDSVLRQGTGPKPSDRITTLATLLGRSPGMDEVKRPLLESFSSSFDVDFEVGGLTAEEKDSVKRLVRERYSCDEWNMRL